MNHTPEQWDGLVRRLNDGGCPVLRDHSYKISPVGLAIEKIPGMSFNQIFGLKQGGTGYEIELVLRNDLDRPIDVVGFQIRTPWGIPKLSLLPAPKKSSAKYPHYSFPEPGPYYEGGSSSIPSSLGARAGCIQARSSRGCSSRRLRSEFRSNSYTSPALL